MQILSVKNIDAVKEFIVSRSSAEQKSFIFIKKKERMSRDC
jgi:hypothetical protein